MKYVTLNNGIKMPLVGFGTFKISNEDCVEVVKEAIECGYRLIDTAQGYQNEEGVGKAIRESGIPREEFFVITKAAFAKFKEGETYQSIIESLEKLQMDYVDCVLLHWPYNDYYGAYRDLEKLYKEGKVKSIGISNFEPGRMIDLIAYNEVVPAINQIETHILNQCWPQHGYMTKYNVHHQAYAPLGQGLRDEMFANPVIAKIAQKYHKTPAQIALRYLVECGVSIIPKSTHVERMKENIDIFDFEFTNEEMEELKGVDTGHSVKENADQPARTEKFVIKK